MDVFVPDQPLIRHATQILSRTGQSFRKHLTSGWLETSRLQVFPAIDVLTILGIAVLASHSDAVLDCLSIESGGLRIKKYENAHAYPSVRGRVHSYQSCTRTLSQQELALVYRLRRIQSAAIFIHEFLSARNDAP